MGIQINGNTDIISATDGSVIIQGASGNVTGDVTGNVTGNLTGNVTGNVNATGVSTFSNIRVTGGTISGVSTAGITTAYVTSINDGPLSGARNIIINGSMVINQRGWTGAAGTTTDGAYTTDRFLIVQSHDGAVSAGQTSMTSGNAFDDGFQNALFFNVTTADASLAAGQYQLIQHRIEGYNVQGIKKGTVNAQPVTLSFWCRSTTTGTYIAELRDIDNGRFCSQAYIINVANTWEKKVLTFPADTTGVFNNDNASSLEVYWWFAAGSTFSGGTLATTWHTTSANRVVGQTNLLASAGNNFWLTGVQLEVGSVATPFERRSYGQELALCQRYFIKQQVNFWHCDINGSNSASDLRAQVNFPTTMRSSPTVTTTIAYTASNVSTTLATQYANPTGFVTYPEQDQNNGVVLMGSYQATIEL